MKRILLVFYRLRVYEINFILIRLHMNTSRLNTQTTQHTSSNVQFSCRIEMLIRITTSKLNRILVLFFILFFAYTIYGYTKYLNITFYRIYF